MKTNPIILATTGVLWIGSLAAAWHFGKQQGASSGPHSSGAQGTDAAAASAPGAPGSSSASGRKSIRTAVEEAAAKPMTVKQILAKATAGMRNGSMNPMGMMKSMALLDAIRLEDIPEALAEVEAMQDAQQKMMLQMSLLGKWAEQDGPAAMKYAEEHPAGNGMMSQVAKMSVASTWAEKDPEAVWAWYKGQPEGQKGGMMGGNMVLSAVFAQMAAQDPAQAFKRLDEIDGPGRQMALAGMFQASMFDEAKRTAILDQVNALPDESERTTAKQMMLGQWAMMAPEDAMKWVATQPAAEQAQLRETMGTMFMMSDPKKGAAFLLEGATDEQKPQRYMQVVASWAATDTTAAGTWLNEQPQGPHLDDARTAFVQNAAGKDPESAMVWAGTITDPAKRTIATGTAYQTWKKKDPSAADAALAASGLTAEQQQQARDTKAIPGDSVSGSFFRIPAAPIAVDVEKAAE